MLADRFFFSFGLIAAGLSIGYALQQSVASRWVRLPFSLDTMRKSLQKAALLFVLPVTIVAAIWIVNIRSTAIAALPFLGFGAIMLGGFLALGAAKILKLPARKTGALYGCGSFTNIGSIGALICYAFLGESGFALVPIYKVFEELTYYGIGFPIAKYFSTFDVNDTESGLGRIRRLARDPFIIIALSSIIVGVLLNLSRIPRPLFFQSLNAVFIPLGTGMLLVSIGLAMRFKSMRYYLKECLSVAAIKFMLVPLAVSMAALLAGLGDIDDKIPLKVVIILSSMPVAFNALIPPSLYDLDLDLASACWFFTTACLAVTLPVLIFILKAI